MKTTSRILVTILTMLIVSLPRGFVYAETEKTGGSFVLDQGATHEEIVEGNALSDEICMYLGLLWEYYYDDNGCASEEDCLLYETLYHEIETGFYIHSDWEQLLNDLLHCYNQKYEVRDPSWDEFRAILRKDYAGITVAKEGFPTKNQVDSLIDDYVVAAGFNRNEMPNTAYNIDPYYERYRTVYTVRLGTSTKKMTIGFTPDLTANGHFLMDVYNLKPTDAAPTLEEQTKAETIARAFLERYPHPFGTLPGDVEFSESIGQLPDEKVLQLVIFIPAPETDTANILNNQWAFFVIGVDSGRIYEYDSMAALDFLIDD